MYLNYFTSVLYASISIENKSKSTITNILRMILKDDNIHFQAHSYRSFQGFCCLMQISTRDRDYLIDTLELRAELHILNDSFTNPSILKVQLSTYKSFSCHWNIKKFSLTNAVLSKIMYM